MKLYTYVNFSKSNVADRLRPVESEFIVDTDDRELDKLKRRVHLGDGLEVDRGVLRHYGVYIGDGNVAELNGLTKGKNKSRVVKLKNFLVDGKSDDIKTIKSGKYSPEQIAERAKKALLAEKIPYSLSKNNCEHFMNEILNDEHKSHQVQGAKNYISVLGPKFAKMFQDSQDKNAAKFRKKYAEFL